VSGAWRLVLLFAVQALALVYMIADRQWTLARGTPVVLATRPVDPRSLFSGDYVRLRYEISRLELAGLGGEREFRRLDPVYVLLRRAAPGWQPVSVHKAMPAERNADQAVVRGEVVGIGRATADRTAAAPVEQRYLEVRYGIESYFVPEGAGRAIGRPGAAETVSMRIAVDARGRAAIQALLVDGKERYVERLF
jgi:uncharacterized membrane-anchored protein